MWLLLFTVTMITIWELDLRQFKFKPIEINSIVPWRLRIKPRRTITIRSLIDKVFFKSYYSRMLFCSEYSLYNFQNCLMEKVTEISFSCFFHFILFSLHSQLYSTFHQIYSLQVLFLSSFIFKLRSWNYEYRWMRALLESHYEVYLALYFSPSPWFHLRKEFILFLSFRVPSGDF